MQLSGAGGWMVFLIWDVKVQQLMALIIWEAKMINYLKYFQNDTKIA